MDAVGGVDRPLSVADTGAARSFGSSPSTMLGCCVLTDGRTVLCIVDQGKSLVLMGFVLGQNGAL